MLHLFLNVGHFLDDRNHRFVQHTAGRRSQVHMRDFRCTFVSVCVSGNVIDQVRLVCCPHSHPPHSGTRPAILAEGGVYVGFMLEH